MKNKPLYMISIVSEMLSIHPQTIRQYERLEFIKPSRTIGNTRLYSEEDLDRLKFIISLTKDMGVNLAGVDIILNMREQIKEMQDKVDFLLKYINDNINSNIKADADLHAVVPVKKGEIIKVKINSFEE